MIKMFDKKEEIIQEATSVIGELLNIAELFLEKIERR